MHPADEYDEDFAGDDAGPEPAPPYWFGGQHLPPDAARMGLTHHVPDGALLDFAGSLDGAKTRHRIAAWMLLVVFGLPVRRSPSCGSLAWRSGPDPSTGHRKATESIPRHISSVVPSPHTTYFSS